MSPESLPSTAIIERKDTRRPWHWVVGGTSAALLVGGLVLAKEDAFLAPPRPTPSPAHTTTHSSERVQPPVLPPDTPTPEAEYSTWQASPFTSDQVCTSGERVSGITTADPGNMLTWRPFKITADHDADIDGIVWANPEGKYDGEMLRFDPTTLLDADPQLPSNDAVIVRQGPDPTCYAFMHELATNGYTLIPTQGAPARLGEFLELPTY